MTFEVFREPLYRRYYSTYTSASFCYALVFGFAVIILPLILAYNSEGFWYKEGTYFEQPSISYRYQSVIELQGRDSNDNSAFSLYYSTSESLKSHHSGIIRSPILQSAEFDDDRNGVNDRIEFTMSMPLKPTETISSMNALIFYDVALQVRAKVQFDAVALVNYVSGSGINNVKIDGDIKLRQTWPLQVKGGMKIPYNDSALLPTSLPYGISETAYSTSHIVEAMAARNLSTTFSQTYAVAEHAFSGSTLTNDINYFNATIQIRVPEQQVWYTPGVSEVLKWAWIQYVSFFVVVSFLVHRLSSFVFRHQLLHTYSTADIITEKMN